MLTMLLLVFGRPDVLWYILQQNTDLEVCLCAMTGDLKVSFLFLSLPLFPQSLPSPSYSLDAPGGGEQHFRHNKAPLPA